MSTLGGKSNVVLELYCRPRVEFDDTWQEAETRGMGRTHALQHRILVELRGIQELDTEHCRSDVSQCPDIPRHTVILNTFTHQ